MYVYVFVCPIQSIWLGAVFKSAGHEYQIIQTYAEHGAWWTSGRPVSAACWLAYQRQTVTEDNFKGETEKQKQKFGIIVLYSLWSI